MKAGKLRQRVTRTRVNGGRLPEFGRLQGPLWIRRVLVRAQEGQWPVQQHRPCFFVTCPPTQARRATAPEIAGAVALDLRQAPSLRKTGGSSRQTPEPLNSAPPIVYLRRSE